MSGLSIQSFKDMGYNIQTNQKQQDMIFDRVAKNIDIMANWAEWRGYEAMNNAQMKAWRGKTNVFSKEKNKSLYSSANKDPVLFWIGQKGKDGELVKKTKDGQWYVDRSSVDSFRFGEKGSGERAAFEKDLLFAKSLLEGAKSPGDFLSEEQKGDMIFLADSVKKGKMTGKEYNDAAKLVLSNPYKSKKVEMDELMDFISKSDSTANPNDVGEDFLKLIQKISQGS